MLIHGGRPRKYALKQIQNGVNFIGERVGNQVAPTFIRVRYPK